MSFLKNNNPLFIIDELLDRFESLELKTSTDLYREKFFGKAHFNYILNNSSGRHAVISVLATPTPTADENHLTYSCLETTELGTKEFILNIPVANENIEEVIMSYLDKEKSSSFILTNLSKQIGTFSSFLSPKATITLIRDKNFPNLFKGKIHSST